MVQAQLFKSMTMRVSSQLFKDSSLFQMIFEKGRKKYPKIVRFENGNIIFSEQMK